MHLTFQRFADHLRAASDANALSEAMAEATKAMQLSSFAYLSISPEQIAPRLITNYPTAWTQHYLRSGYQLCDPVVRHAVAQFRPFMWGPNMNLPLYSNQQNDFLIEAAMFGIRHGYTIPIHDSSGPKAAVTFAADERRPSFNRCIEENAGALQLMAFSFHAQAQRTLDLRRDLDGVSLSPREVDCLAWVAQGKSAWEIGRILGISHHTVASYLDSAKKKLNVRTVVQAAIRFAAAMDEEQK